MYDAQGFGTLNATRHGHHTGKDINGIGGENTDLGEPVCAAGRGLVVYSGCPTPEWGNVVVLLHRLPGEDGYVQTLYAHLRQRDVRVGQYVARGSDWVASARRTDATWRICILKLFLRCARRPVCPATIRPAP